MLQLAADEGYESVTVRKLSKLAGVSSASFYARFDGKEECFLASCSLILDRIRERVRAVRSYRHDRPTQLTRTVEAFLAEPTSNPEIARVALVDSLGGGPAASACMQKFEMALEAEVKDNLSRRGVRTSTAVASWITAGCFRASRRMLASGGCEEELARRLSSWGMSYLEGVPELDLRPSATPGASPREIHTPDGRSCFKERETILAAVSKLAARGGYWRLRVSTIRRQAGVSRRAFDSHFVGVEDCYLAAADELVRSYLSMVVVSTDSPISWAEQVLGAITALTRRLTAEPEKARLAFLGILEPGPSGLRLRERLISEFSTAWEMAATPPDRRSSLAAEATLGAFWTAIAQRLDPAMGASLTTEAPTLAFFLLAPSLGPVVAREVIVDGGGSVSPLGSMARIS